MAKQMPGRAGSFRLAALGPLLAALWLALAPPPALAQTFGAVARVGDRIVTGYERDQRAQLLQLFGTEGDLQTEALERLIDERLQLEAAARAGVTVSDEAILTGMEEFAARVNLSREDFLTAIGEAGVAEETFRDFVRAGILWRETVQRRFGPQVEVTPAEIDRALAEVGAEGGLRMRLTEIVLPADTPETRRASEARAARLGRIATDAEFADAARRFSIAASRLRGGDVDWRPLASLPEPVQAVVANLQVGQNSRPLPSAETIALFRVTGRETVTPAAAGAFNLDIAQVLIPQGTGADGATRARRLAETARSCEDLAALAGALEVTRSIQPAAALAPDLRALVDSLDPNEASAELTRGPDRLLVMLCSRTSGADTALNRTAVRGQLLNQRLGSYAASYLAELRAETEIVVN